MRLTYVAASLAKTNLQRPASLSAGPAARQSIRRNPPGHLVPRWGRRRWRPVRGGPPAWHGEGTPRLRSPRRPNVPSSDAACRPDAASPLPRREPAPLPTSRPAKLRDPEDAPQPRCLPTV